MYPCIVPEYYPIRLGKNCKIPICYNFDDVKKVIELKELDLNNVVRNITLKDTEIYYEKTEEWDKDREIGWYKCTANIETLVNINKF